MAYHWIKTNWTVRDLDLKTVEFRTAVKGKIVASKGRFWVRESPKGLLAIEIVYPTRTEPKQIRFVLNQEAANKITLHPDQSVAAFILK
jgi:hypothetical protein